MLLCAWSQERQKMLFGIYFQNIPGFTCIPMPFKKSSNLITVPFTQLKWEVKTLGLPSPLLRIRF